MKFKVWTVLQRGPKQKWQLTEHIYSTRKTLMLERGWMLDKAIHKIVRATVAVPEGRRE